MKKSSSNFGGLHQKIGDKKMKMKNNL